MDGDDHVCLCYRVSLRKIVNFMNREKPAVASRLSECLDAGTGCHWCVPFLEKLHAQWQAGSPADPRIQNHQPLCPVRHQRTSHLQDIGLEGSRIRHLGSRKSP